MASATASVPDYYHSNNPHSERSSLTAMNYSCAFPAWPQRSSFTSGNAREASSYISDEDLFLDLDVHEADRLRPGSSSSSLDDGDCFVFDHQDGCDSLTQRVLLATNSNSRKSVRRKKGGLKVVRRSTPTSQPRRTSGSMPQRIPASPS